MSYNFARLFVCITGAAVMIIELTAARIIAPWFGTSQFIWANIIGVVLLALSTGYWFGGKVADRFPQTERLMLITVFGGLSSCLAPAFIIITGGQVGLVLWHTFGGALSLIIGSFLMIIALFGLPIFLLGMISPYTIRLTTTALNQAGRTAGQLYAWSTIGSLLGTFGSAFILIPLLGSRATMLLAASSVIIIAVLGLGKRWLFLLVLLLIPASLGLIASSSWLHPNDNLIAERESAYQFIQVHDHGDRLTLAYNEGLGTQSYYMKTGVLTSSYYDYLALLPYLHQFPEQAQVAILGLAGGTLARELVQYFPNYHITGVEIDPVVIELAQQYFHLNELPITIINQDARQFINQTNQTFDYVAIDAFSNELYIPWQLTTTEFFAVLKQRLNAGGVVAFNVGSLNEHTDLFQALTGTLQTQFSHLAVIPVPGSFNYVVMASDQPFTTAALNSVVDERSTIANYASIGYHTIQPRTNLVLTDDRAPIEFYTEAMVLSYAQDHVN